MFPILICSFFALAIIVERLLFYRLIKFNHHPLLLQIWDYIKSGKFKDALELCDRKPSHITRVVKAGLINRNEPKEIIQEAMENVSLYEIPKLEKNLNFLSTIAHISPLLGLLGTVVGLVKCFYIIEQKTAIAGSVNPADLAGGIWEALLTTVFGLGVAIVAYLFYNYFVHMVNLAILESERAATEFLEIIFKRKNEVQKAG